MDLKEKLQYDLVNAMKAHNKEEVNTLRLVKGAVQLEVINNKKEENDDLILDIISKQIKMRNESISEFKLAKRQDLVDSYQQEIDILKKYLPQKLSDDELENVIAAAFIKIKPESIKDLSKIMAEISPKVKNRCDMKELSMKIRERLN